MGRVIKKGNTGLGDIEPDSGLSEVRSKSTVISSEKYEARNEAQEIRARAQNEAQRTIDEAHNEAKTILEKAQTQSKQIKDDAQKQGYDEGRAKGASELAEVVAGASRRMQQIEEQAVPQLKELALSIARKILGKELEFHPESVISIVKEALNEKARQRREIFLRVHPDDMAMIRENKAELLEVLSRCKEIGIREDPEVKRFGVIIETDAGIIDAQLETQLAVFERVLKDN